MWICSKQWIKLVITFRILQESLATMIVKLFLVSWWYTESSTTKHHGIEVNSINQSGHGVSMTLLVQFLLITSLVFYYYPLNLFLYHTYDLSYALTLSISNSSFSYLLNVFVGELLCSVYICKESENLLNLSTLLKVWWVL